jgi:hypothetical protein
MIKCNQSIIHIEGVSSQHTNHTSVVQSCLTNWVFSSIKCSKSSDSVGAIISTTPAASDAIYKSRVNNFHRSEAVQNYYTNFATRTK